MRYSFHISYVGWYRKGYALPLFLDVLRFRASKCTNGHEEWWGQFDVRILNVDFILNREKV